MYLGYVSQPALIRGCVGVFCAHTSNSCPSDFADEFPEAEVTGIDLSPTQSTWVPPNYKFELGDASQD